MTEPATQPNPPLASPTSKPDGGAAISGGYFNSEGGQQVLGGVGYDQRGATIITEERSYEVSGLPNPYLGLRSYTYADRAIYAGREAAVASTTSLLTDPADPRPLFFITGCSGSGKSSLAQAGVLPAVAAFYDGRQLASRFAVMRPGSQPMVALADALTQLGLASGMAADLLPQLDSSAAFNQFVADNTPAEQINLLLLDQFEEMFTQAQPSQRDSLLAILTELAPVAQSHTHIVATMRVDYLPNLFTYKPLYDIAKAGLDLRTMSVAELKAAIQQPVQTLYPDSRIEPALVERLATDAAQDSSYLPLLQVTLEELWRGGSLRLAAYRDLTSAIRERAEVVYQYADHTGVQQTVRTAVEQQTMLGLLLDLVQVSPDAEFADVRARRERRELVRDDATRARLVDELVTARLLSARAALVGEGVTVEIIHESLIKNWARLGEAIKEERGRLVQRERFERQLADWLAAGKPSDYLLTGARLAEANELAADADVATQAEAAREFLRQSAAAAAAQQERELNEQRVRAQAAEELAQATRQRLRLVRRGAVAVSILLVVAIIAGFFAFAGQEAANRAQQATELQRLAAVAAEETAVAARAEAEGQRQVAVAAEGTAVAARSEAERQLQISEAQRLAFAARSELTDNPQTAVLLAAEAVSRDANFDTRQILRAALDQLDWRPTFLANFGDRIDQIAVSPDGKLVAGVVGDRVRLWDAAGQSVLTYTQVISEPGYFEFSSNGKYLYAGVGSDPGSRQPQTLVWAVGVPISDSLRLQTNAKVETIRADTLLLAEAGGWRLWSPDNQVMLEAVEGLPRDSAVSWAISPAGRFVWAITPTRSWLWGRDGRLLRDYASQQALIFDASPNDAALLIRVSKSLTITNGADLDLTLSNLDEVNVTPDSRYLLLLTEAGQVELRRSSDGGLVATLPDVQIERSNDGTQHIPSLTFDNELIVTASSKEGEEDAMQLWGMDGGLRGLIREVAPFDRRAWVAPNGQRVVVTARLNLAGRASSRLFDGNGSLRFNNLDEDVSKVIFNPDSSLFLTDSGSNHEFKLWDAQLNEKLADLSPSKELSFSADGRYVWENSSSGLRVRDRTGRLLPGTARGVASGGIAFEADDAVWLSLRDGTAARWQPGSSYLPSFYGEARTNASNLILQYTADGSRLLLINGAVARLYAADGQQLALLNPATLPLWWWTLAPDGRVLAVVGNEQRSFALWDRDGQPLTNPYSATDREITEAQFGADGSLLTSGAVSRAGQLTVQIWNKDGSLRRELQVKANSIGSVWLDPGGTNLLAASDGLV